MDYEKKYKLLKFGTLTLVLFIIAILLVYMANYDIVSLNKLEVNYYTASLGAVTWLGFVFALMKTILTYD